MMIIQNCIECKILGKQNWRMRILAAGRLNLFQQNFPINAMKKIGACVPPAPIFF